MIKIIVGVVVIFGMLFVHEVGEYAEDINPYGHDVGNDFEEEAEE